MKYFVELPEVWATEFLEDDPSCNGYWISSLTQSWQKGYPDNCSLPWSHYVELVRRLRMHTQKEIMVDVDKSELEKNTLNFDVKIHSLLQPDKVHLLILGKMLSLCPRNNKAT